MSQPKAFGGNNSQNTPLPNLKASPSIGRDDAHMFHPPPSGSRDAYINMKPMVMARELESEFQLLTDLRARYTLQLNAAKAEEAQLLRLRQYLVTRDGQGTEDAEVESEDEERDALRAILAEAEAEKTQTKRPRVT